MSFPQELIQQIHDVATCRIPHVYNGKCPDAVEGPDVRDEECPACKVLIGADRVLNPVGDQVLRLATALQMR